MTPLPPLSFLLVALAMIAIATAFVVPTLWRDRVARRGRSRAALNVDVHRAQLDELRRQHADGTLDAQEYAIASAEVERRLIDDVPFEPEDAGVAARPQRAAALAVVATLAAGAVALYALFGTPDALTTADAVDAVSRDGSRDAQREALANHVARNPGDARSLVLLARMDLESERFADAVPRYEKALALSPKVASDPSVWCELADALGMLQGGVLEGRPRELVERALALDPRHPMALEMAGSAAYERRDYAAAARHWRALQDGMSPGTGAYAQLAAAIERADQKGRLMLR